jgi:hypothetical protein
MPSPPNRLIIVRRGATELFLELQRRFAEDPETLMLWDRRTGDRRQAAVPVLVERRQSGKRRFSVDEPILSVRGFFISRAVRRRDSRYYDRKLKAS